MGLAWLLLLGLCLPGINPCLLQACSAGDLEAVQIFLRRDSECLKHADDNGNTLLHKAVQGGNAKVVALLLKKGASLEAKDKVSYTSA